MNYSIKIDGKWFGPVKNPVEMGDGWLKYGQMGQGRIKAGNWKKDPLEPAPRLASKKPRLIPGLDTRLTFLPELLANSLSRCFCCRCGGYFRDESAFSAHQIGVKCATEDRELRNAGLRIVKRHSIRGHEVLEWGE